MRELKVLGILVWIYLVAGSQIPNTLENFMCRYRGTCYAHYFLAQFFPPDFLRLYLEFIELYPIVPLILILCVFLMLVK